MKVKQVKIFNAAEEYNLEQNVNKFLMIDRPVIHDIKFVCVDARPSGKNLYSCLIVYETEADVQSEED